MSSPRQLLATLARPHTGTIALSTALAVAQALLLLPIPLLLGYAFDSAIGDGRRDLVVAAAAAMSVALLISSLAGVASIHLQTGTATRIGEDLRTSLLRRVFDAPRELFDHSLTSDLHDRIVNDSARSVEMFGAAFNRLVPDAVLTFGVTVILVVLDWRLALVTLGAVPLLALVTWAMMRVQRPATAHFHARFRDFSARVLLILRGQDRIRILGSEGRELAVAEAELAALRTAHHRFEFIVGAHAAVQQSVVGLTGAALLVAGGFLVIDGSMTLGELLAFYAAFALLRTPAGRGAASYGKVVSGWQAFERIHEFLGTSGDAVYDGTTRVALEGRLSLVGVSFGYDESQPVLHDLSFCVSPGRITALVGPNGSGKSTVVNLLLGFYRPDEGSVLADGIPYDEIDIHHFRMQLGVVRQDPFLFPGTIRDNVTYGSDADDAALAEALEISGAARVIEAMPQGLDTVVGDDGHLLSGGQRQRLAIARALLGRPRVLVLDEPTNHLDERAIAELLDRVEGLRASMAILLISHQRAIRELADDVVDLGAGGGPA